MHVIPKISRPVLKIPACCRSGVVVVLSLYPGGGCVWVGGGGQGEDSESWSLKPPLHYYPILSILRLYRGVLLKVI